MKTTDTSTARDASIAREADSWARTFAAGPLSPGEARAFNQWIAADPQHERRFQAAKRFQRELVHVAQSREYDDWIRPSLYEKMATALTAVVERVSFKARWAGAAYAGLAASLAFVVVVSIFATPDSETNLSAAPPVATAIAEVREVALPDGSLVTLGAASSIQLAFTDRERRVILNEGEAFFDVERDETRPFIVVADNTLLRVLGTKFDVNVGSDGINVAVSEGRVQVIRPDAPNAEIDEDDIKHVLTAGQRVTAPKSGAVRAVRPINVEDVAIWRRGELQWADTPLRDIVSDLNRYADYEIVLDAEQAAGLEYTLAVQATQVDEAVTLIAASLHLDVVRRADGDLILR